MQIVYIDGKKYFGRYPTFSMFFNELDYNELLMIISKIKEGENVETFYEELSTVRTIKKDNRLQEIERFITKIGNPMFNRYPENNKKNTFDYIAIEAYINTRWKNDRKKYIEENKDKIISMIVSKVENDTSFKKYGVPMNFLKLSQMKISLRYNLIQFIFELKEF